MGRPPCRAQHLRLVMRELQVDRSSSTSNGVISLSPSGKKKFQNVRSASSSRLQEPAGLQEGSGCWRALEASRGPWGPPLCLACCVHALVPSGLQPPVPSVLGTSSLRRKCLSTPAGRPCSLPHGPSPCGGPGAEGRAVSAPRTVCTPCLCSWGPEVPRPRRGTSSG